MMMIPTVRINNFIIPDTLIKLSNNNLALELSVVVQVTGNFTVNVNYDSELWSLASSEVEVSLGLCWLKDVKYSHDNLIFSLTSDGTYAILVLKFDSL